MGKWLSMLNPKAAEDPAPAKLSKVHDFTLVELEAETEPGEWQEVKDNPDALEAFAKSLAQRRGMAKGEVPDHYTKAAECAHCGPVWLWEGAPEHVSGCPWCLNSESIPSGS